MAAADEHAAVVIAVAMQGNESALQARGADIGVANLREISIDGDNAAASKNTLALPSALEQADDLLERLHHKRVAIFLDYDGTLTAIVERIKPDCLWRCVGPLATSPAAARWR
jgi:trehalose 6-phosphate phosphatase